MPKNLLSKLRIKAANAGTCSGPQQWLEDAGGTWLVSNNPTTGREIARVRTASPAAYETTVKRSRAAFESWRSMPAPQRGQLVRDLGNALRAQLEPLGELIALEVGKIRAEGIGEVQEMIDICDFAVGLSRQLYGLTMHSERPGHRMYEQWHPLGPVGVITAFNFPAAVWSWNAAVAAVCGDTVVWKPSELAPLTAIAIQHIANDVMANHGVTGVFSLAVGDGRQVGVRLVADPRIPLLAFTGSIRTGREVAQAVSARLGRSLLELGGNNAIVVAADANLSLAVRAILFGAVGTAGQRCTSTRRIIVHRSVAKPLAQRLARAYKQVVVGDPLRPATLMGPLITAQAVAAMQAALRRAVADGGKLLFGGRVRLDLGPQFVEPAIVQMPKQTEIVCAETFAPILYLMEFDTMAEAVALHNGVDQGLSSAIFTESVSTMERFLAAGGSDCGIANVNIGTSGAEIGGAFGGEKDTGGGRESGSDAWKAYMRRQTTTINWSGQLPLAQGIKFGAD
jgi:aldehyde dehydrogenase (NAD+)